MSTMIAETKTTFEELLWKYDETEWNRVISSLLGSIHEVDKNAVQIWFAFYPLSLFQALKAAPDPELLRKQLLMQGNFYLKDQIDSSHAFLYGHRFWPQTKKAVEKWRLLLQTSHRRICRRPSSTRLTILPSVSILTDLSSLQSQLSLS